MSLVGVIPPEQLRAALADPALEQLPAGPGRELIELLREEATLDYDPGDVLLIVVRPPTRSRG